MKSKVYFVPVNNNDDIDAVKLKVGKLLAESEVLDFVQKEDKVALKLHFGEEGNTGYVKPQYLRVICDAIFRKEGKPFLSDTNTLYRGRRINSKDHFAIAFEHGFTREALGADVIIPDDTKKSANSEVKINRRFIKIAKVSSIFTQADAIVGIAHFKGHIMTAFAGALKNIGMGCASREGKLAQHSDISPHVILNNCVGCAACEAVCPVKAIQIVDKKSRIDSAKCIGCASCIAVCKYNAMDVNWEAGGEKIQEKMAEYAYAVLRDKKGRQAFLNFALKITKECDCLAKDDPRIAPDIGIFASLDPVSIDKASFDLINQVCGRDIFKEAHPQRDGMKQLRYAVELGLGSMDYDLVEVK